MSCRSETYISRLEYQCAFFLTRYPGPLEYPKTVGAAFFFGGVVGVCDSRICLTKSKTKSHLKDQISWDTLTVNGISLLRIGRNEKLQYNCRMLVKCKVVNLQSIMTMINFKWKHQEIMVWMSSYQQKHQWWHFQDRLDLSVPGKNENRSKLSTMLQK